jgi:hypothetical protein
MDRPPKPEPDRRGALEIFVIGAVVAGLFYAGVRLIGDTHVAFDARKEARAARHAEIRAASMPQPVAWGPDEDAEYLRLKAEAEARRLRIEADQRQTRCVGGVLFRVDGNSYTNIGRC